MLYHMNSLTHRTPSRCVSVSLFLPFAFQPPNGPPPDPTNDTVHIQTLNAMTFGVLSFDGKPDGKALFAEAAELSQLLRDSGMRYDDSNWIYAGYDPPERLKGRHNEVWIQIFDSGTRFVDHISEDNYKDVPSSWAFIIHESYKRGILGKVLPFVFVLTFIGFLTLIISLIMSGR